MVNGNAPIKTGAWDPEEDDLLYYWQSKVGNKWSEVAKHIPGRTGQQCAQRWRHKVNPNIRRDKWTAEEDAKLIELVKTFGVGRWAEIARNCDGRTDQQCMGRWRRHLDPNIRRDSWSPEEDNKLRQLHAQFGTSWSRISKCLKGRTSQQCRARWHQINNGRGGKSAGTTGGSTAGSGKQTAGGKRAAQAGKRKQSRRHSEFSDSDDEEEELESENDDGDYEPDYEHDCENTSDSPHIASIDGTTAEVAAAYYDPQAMAAAAAAAAAAGCADMHGLDMQLGHNGAQLQQQDWAKVLAGQAAVAAAAAAAAHLQCDDLTCGTDQEEEATGEGEDGSDDEQAAAAVGCSSHRIITGSRTAGGKHSGLPPIKHEHRAAAAARHRDAGSSTWFSPQRQQQWSPSRVLISPRQQARAEWQQLQRKASSSSKAGSELNEEEAAGAETLLQMAHLLRRESREFEPPSLCRSDFITASTPPKRQASEQPDLHAADELTPSPFKRPRSSRGPLFTRLGVDGVHDDGSLPGLTRGAAAAIEAAADRETEAEDQDGSATAAGAKRTEAAAAGQPDQAADEVDADDYMDAGVNKGDEEEGAGLGDAHDPILGFGLGSYASGHLPDPPARPSNASSLTGVHAGSATAAAASSAAAVFLSPPPVPRVPGSSGRWRETTGAVVTPRRPTAQQNLMNLLGSPSFDRMAGYASPPSAGRTQPSAATLAALQSPQPSCVHEPFWTPFTGLFKDAMFTRGTSATPDLPSGGKLRSSSVGLFSPGRRSNSASKAMQRRSLLASPAPASHAADDSRASGIQAVGSNTKPATPACPADSETGPSPAAACGLQSAQQVNHRVVRRLDQHEAWGTPLPAASSAVKAKDAPVGTGFSLFSPVKKQRVPLFNEGSAINIGVSPAKPEPTDLPGCSLTIAPLSHDLPSSNDSLPGNLSSPQERHSLSSPRSHAVTGLPHGRSPLGPYGGSSGPTMSWRRPPASQLLSALPKGLLMERSQQRPAQQEQQEPEPPQHHPVEELEPDGSPMAISPEAGEAAVVSTDSQAAREQQQAQEIVEEPPAVVSSQSDDTPDTPVHLPQATSDNTSCSGTPNTPADRSNLARGAGTSPSDYVTPQQRMRLSRPLAPLHKDCLIAAATRSLASMSNAQDAPNHATPATACPANSGAAGKASAGDVNGAAKARPSAASADASTGQQSGSVPNSADSSKHDGFMDSPLQPCQQLQSPTSQWHQGMVAMLRNLQQTPLQPGAVCDISAAGCDVHSELAEAGSKIAETAAVRPGSRALRRLQDELERGSGVAAAAAAAAQQQQSCSRAIHVQMPFSSAIVTSPATVAVAGSAPKLLPLFNTSVSCSGQSELAAISGAMATPVAAGVGSSVASVSLAPAVMSCSRGEVFTMQAPVTSAMPSLPTTAGLPAMAWPVQQRPDGGLVLSVPSDGDAAANAVLQLTPPPSTLCSSNPPAASDKENAACSSAALMQQQHHSLPMSASTADTAAAAAVSSMLQSQWASSSRVAVVSLQPVSMLASMLGAASAAAPAGLAAVQPMLAMQQPGKSCSTAVVEQRKLSSTAGAAGNVQPERYDSSHAVRSRLHALIDGV